MSIPKCKSLNNQNQSKKSKNPKNNKALKAGDLEQQKIELINSRVNNFFHGENLNEIAKKVGYLVRTSPLTPFIFLHALSLGMCGTEISMNLLASNANDIFNTDLTGSAFSQRMAKKESVLFLKTCFEKFSTIHYESTFENKISIMFPMFKAIVLEDSTSIELSETLKSIFPGSGGAASKSAVKLNFVFNFSVFGVMAVDVCSGSTPDQKIAGNSIKHLKKGMLIVRDMGYFVLKSLVKIDEMGAFYLSRVPKGTLIYLNKDDKKPLDIKTFFKKMTRGNKSCKIKVFLGKEERFPTTLILQRAPKGVLEKRKKKYQKKNSGRLPSEDFITWARYTIFITNIPEELLLKDNADGSFEKLIMEIYRIRWQIELLFKKFKSNMKLRHIKGKGKNQVRCLLYGKLISILLNLMVLSYAASESYNGREISLWKVNAWLINKDRLANAILEGTLDELYSDLRKRFKLLCKDRRNRKTTLEELEEALRWEKSAA